jgi:pimeloyl-ACP methyl ester carboxylesterase
MDFDLPAPRSTIEVPLDDGGKIHVRCHGNPNGVR